MTNDAFGASVSLSGNTLVVGALTNNSGMVYVFVSGATTPPWSQQQELTVSTAGGAGAGFGRSVAISGDTIVAGSGNETQFTPIESYDNAAYVFVRGAATPPGRSSRN